MKLFVFLGNIGTKYAKTRHNAGFLFGDYLRKKWGFSEWKEVGKFFGAISEGIRNREKIIFLKPGTLMNLSGKAVLAVKNFHKISLQNILLFHDDKDMEFGKIRFREQGSSGGHNGVQDCLLVLGTDEIKRVKIGVDNEQRAFFTETADFVLARFTEGEWGNLEKIFEAAEVKIRERFL